jgi:hypothetical protein
VQEGDGGGVPSLFLGPVAKRKRQGSGGRRRHCGGKKSKFTPAPIFISLERVVGIMVSVPLPRPFLWEVATWWHGVGRRFL